MTEVTVRVGKTEVTVTAITEAEERAIPEVARKMGTLVGYDHYYYSDVAFEIAEGTPEDVIGETELTRIGAKIGIARDTDEWDVMNVLFWALVEKAQEEWENLADEDEE